MRTHAADKRRISRTIYCLSVYRDSLSIQSEMKSENHRVPSYCVSAHLNRRIHLCCSRITITATSAQQTDFTALSTLAYGADAPRAKINADAERAQAMRRFRRPIYNFYGFKASNNTGCCYTVVQLSTVTNLSITDPTVAVFVDLANHRLQSEMSLRTTEFLHHVFQLIEIDEFISVDVVTKSATNTQQTDFTALSTIASRGGTSSYEKNTDAERPLAMRRRWRPLQYSFRKAELSTWVVMKLRHVAKWIKTHIVISVVCLIRDTARDNVIN